MDTQGRPYISDSFEFYRSVIFPMNTWNMKEMCLVITWICDVGSQAQAGRV
jgi:hypothetical protein